MLPHRYPFLLVDRILEIEPGKRVVGLKNVTINEAFFQGHFPGQPIMPGVLVIEAMAQTGGVLLMRTLNVSAEKKLVYFTGIDRAKFRRPVLPGDQLRFEIELLQMRSRNCRMQGMAFVQDKLAAEAELSCMVVDRESPNLPSGVPVVMGA
ncbi:3-hydroxyacyl-ACP dehydratase [Candidatus Methylomirabilis lanthanidiphila]|uniref:3-hydroxyacyl-[acyl-carrier-protein] dehydratase FabZ n=1 Tax=Candidatus Methylomirabilis lanthanidiphila TaxID=2211376 RepID=A0A564ZLI5_9BACT|nr:3-hydroxyacyl-ACP dehydratase FabZ [Candidatus Methylomirabilis lanthanidiphila]VUZ85966.1 3-hydroxyacyl-ACP dehydratase [Candidatus Methylomirabilis lanthanidiphila]